MGNADSTPKKLPTLKEGMVLFDGRYAIDGQITGGTYGDIYRAVAKDPDEEYQVVAVKVQPKTPVSAMEIAALEDLRHAANRNENGNPNDQLPFPQFIAIHQTNKRRIRNLSVLAMELCGPSLWHLRGTNDGDRFSLNTSIYIMGETVRALSYLHGCGYLHQDVTQANICVGLDGREELTARVVLVDYGLCRQYNVITGDPQRIHAEMRSTPPVAMHEKHRCSGRKDDLWAVFFMTVENATGHRPVLPRGFKDRDRVGQLHVKDTENLLREWPDGKAPECLYKFLELLLSYRFDSAPDYDRIVGDLTAGLGADFDPKRHLDWFISRHHN